MKQASFFDRSSDNLEEKNQFIEYRDLRDKINELSYQYYVCNVSLVSDAEYDALMRRLEEIEHQHPEWISPDSPSQRVGGQPA